MLLLAKWCKLILGKGLILLAVYAISDLHLSFGTDKPMNIFGPKWENYTNKLKENWQTKICPEDVDIIPGDISWAMYLEDAVEDFKLIAAMRFKCLAFCFAGCCSRITVYHDAFCTASIILCVIMTFRNCAVDS